MRTYINRRIMIASVRTRNLFDRQNLVRRSSTIAVIFRFLQQPRKEIIRARVIERTVVCLLADFYCMWWTLLSAACMHAASCYAYTHSSRQQNRDKNRDRTREKMKDRLLSLSTRSHAASQPAQPEPRWNFKRVKFRTFFFFFCYTTIIDAYKLTIVMYGQLTLRVHDWAHAITDRNVNNMLFT